MLHRRYNIVNIYEECQRAEDAPLRNTCCQIPRLRFGIISYDNLRSICEVRFKPISGKQTKSNMFDFFKINFMINSVEGF